MNLLSTEHDAFAKLESLRAALNDLDDELALIAAQVCGDTPCAHTAEYASHFRDVLQRRQCLKRSIIRQAEVFARVARQQASFADPAPPDTACACIDQPPDARWDAKLDTT